MFLNYFLHIDCVHIVLFNVKDEKFKLNVLITFNMNKRNTHLKGLGLVKMKYFLCDNNRIIRSCTSIVITGYP